MDLKLIFPALLAGSTALGVSSTSLRVDPHQYPGLRGSEPQEQLVFSVNQRFSDPLPATPSELAFHLAAEARGRRDVSIDLDRAWIRAGSFTFGRLHPFDVSSHPDAHRPWGLVGSGQPQSKGLLLGYEYSSSNLEPSPLLLGLIGVHFWSDPLKEESFQWGFSASPLFIPTMGSEVTLSGKEPASVARFARRPPGNVLVDGKTYPLYFEIDSSRLWQDVLLNPQAYLQFRYENTWLVLSQAPSPDPVASSLEDYLIVSPDALYAYARVAPRFEQRTGVALTQKLPLLNGDIPTSAFTTLSLYSNSYWGYEGGIEAGFVTLSLLEERNFGEALSSSFRTSESRYTDLLGQLDLRIPIQDFQLSAGAKHHLRQDDLWLRAGVGYQMNRSLSFQSNLDIFAGPDASYFGEWRSNDRISLVMQWEFEG